MNQPEALRLADELEMWTLGEPAAAELRRLHARLIACEDIAERAIAGCARLSAQRDALLEALKTLVLATKGVSVGRYNEEVHDIALSKARDAIKAVEEKT